MRIEMRVTGLHVFRPSRDEKSGEWVRISDFWLVREICGRFGSSLEFSEEAMEFTTS